MEHECLREKRRGEGNVSITLRDELRIGGGEKEISVMQDGQPGGHRVSIDKRRAHFWKVFLTSSSKMFEGNGDFGFDWVTRDMTVCCWK